MEKKEIEKELTKIRQKFHIYTVGDEYHNGSAMDLENVEECMKQAFNLALEISADEVELDYWEGDCQLCRSNKIDKKSILKYKLS